MIRSKIMLPNAISFYESLWDLKGHTLPEASAPMEPAMTAS